MPEEHNSGVRIVTFLLPNSEFYFFQKYSYGDRSPRSIPGRVFAIIWTLVGLVITGIMVGDLAASLTLSVSESEKMIYGAEVNA